MQARSLLGEPGAASFCLQDVRCQGAGDLRHRHGQSCRREAPPQVHNRRGPAARRRTQARWPPLVGQRPGDGRRRRRAQPRARDSGAIPLPALVRGGARSSAHSGASVPTRRAITVHPTRLPAPSPEGILEEHFRTLRIRAASLRDVAPLTTESSLSPTPSQTTVRSRRRARLSVVGRWRRTSWQWRLGPESNRRPGLFACIGSPMHSSPRAAIPEVSR